MPEWEPTRRGVKAFLAQLDPNKTYYTVHTEYQPWGEERTWRPWRFDQRKPPLGGYWCGAVSAEGALRRFGPISDERPGSHIRPMFACDDDGLYATPEDVLKVLASRRAEARR
ncbi:hypothetical protein [Streptomyces sp. NPDC059649]|uniref:hypothetical protein n=1 Tax=Streptomyces sp. NPDC059649 TaxID=3346895 RepID=UPI00369DA629